ncbi:Mog1p/PsbP-like protein [Polyplosphaeria fusca]|uniref:Mog1p/PsbP-like protein n=1 Tax=Polyplosphaeria fusca TaxID=682080 RepID=A0A9P4V6H7_9PLEO|nr:Mog1p/PsbP-like protein [Polyplosphaeria fusca]
MSFNSTPLFGGAITVSLPANFGDASQIRQIPDHQEVFLDADGFTSIVFEILEWVDKPSDEQALQYHFQDLIEDTGDSTNVLDQSEAVMLHVADKPVYTLNYIQTPPAQTGEQRRPQADFISIHLVLLRLKEKGTDILATVNVPHYPEQYVKVEGGKATKLMEDGEAVKEKILQTFEIKDWGLFDA